MKTRILNREGKESKEIVLPSCFSSMVREDICQKYFEINKKIQPYGPNEEAGMKYSASGKIRHRRHKWKSAYGRGISRVPRKIFWRRGTQFYWQGATIASAVGGRKAHPPKPEHFMKKKKINKKEKLIAISSALSSTAIPEYIKKRYKSLKGEIKVPIVVSSEILKLKTKDFLSLLKKILKEDFKLALKDKKKAGLLFVIGKNENFKCKRVEVKKVSDLGIENLWPLGRLCIYTEKAISDLEKLWEKEKRSKEK